VKQGEKWGSASLQWIHEVRESQYRATRRLPLKAWLKLVDAGKVARACRRMGLKVRLQEGTGPRRLSLSRAGGPAEPRRRGRLAPRRGRA
jgi:hypothetical protein